MSLMHSRKISRRNGGQDSGNTLYYIIDFPEYYMLTYTNRMLIYPVPYFKIKQNTL